MSTLEDVQVKSDYVLATLIPEEEKVGSLYVTGPVERSTKRAVVVAVGPGYHSSQGKFVPTTLLPNDEIIFPASIHGQIGAGINLTGSDRESYACFFIRERDVLAKSSIELDIDIDEVAEIEDEVDEIEEKIDEEISIIEQHEKHEG